MLKRLLTDISISSLILVMIGGAYFMTAQRVLHESINGFELCGNIEAIEESISKLELRKGLIDFKDLPASTKKSLAVGYDEQILLFKGKLEECIAIR